MPRKQREETDVGEINLIPIMAILCILIPVILYAFNFFEVKIQAVSAPRMGRSQKKPQDQDKKPLNLTVLVTKENFQLKMTQELMKGSPEPKIFKKRFMVERTEKGKKITEEVETYDYPALYNRLVEKKNEYPDETTINIGAEMDIPWATVARTIDAARVRLCKDSYTELMEYARAKTKQACEIEEKCGKTPSSECRKGVEEKVMFPAVVFVVAE